MTGTRADRAAATLAAALPLFTLIALMIAHVSPLRAQALAAEAEPEPAEQVHWALGAFFGTGWYQVADNRSVFVLRIPPRQVLRESSLSADGTRGVRSRYRLGGGRQWSLLNEAYFAGYKPEFENRGRYGGVKGGLEWNQPLAGARWRGEPLFLDWHLTYDWFFDELNFHVERDRVATIRDQWEFGLALGGGDRPLEFAFLSFDHVGLGYRWSSNGEFRAITLNFSSPFLD